MADGFSPDADVCETFIAYCKEQQLKIAKHQKELTPAAWQKKMLAAYKEELAFGTQYQNEYHKFEAEQIAAGVPLSAPNFYDAFFAAHAPIASDPGLSDHVRITHIKPKTIWDYAPLTLFGLGLGVSLALLIRRKRA